MPPETSDWEIFVDVSGKKRQGKKRKGQGKKRKGVKIEKKRRKIARGGGSFTKIVRGCACRTSKI